MNILDGRKSFYQWDLNQKITSEKFKVGDEIHFHNIRQSEALVVLAYEFDGKVVADVPNILLSTPLPIHAYVYVTEDTASKTIYEKIFTVEQRAKPSDYVYSETELYTITTAVNKALKDAKESGEFDGVSVTHSWDGTVLTINSASGTSSADLKGKDAVIDQVYNPESENAQSGIATASAIANTKSEIDSVIDSVETSIEAKADSSTTLAGYGITDSYTKSEVDTSINSINTTLSSKADAATTLIGYGITDAYTKTEVDSKIGDIETALDQIISLENSYIGGERA